MITTLTGKIVAVLDKKEGVSKSGTAYATQDYVLEEIDGKNICFNVFGSDKIEMYGIKVGMNVSVTIEVSSREWNGRYFTQVRCLQCYTQNAAPAPQQQPQPQPYAAAPQQTVAVNQPQVEKTTKVSSDDLPF